MSVTKLPRPVAVAFKRTANTASNSDLRRLAIWAARQCFVHGDSPSAVFMAAAEDALAGRATTDDLVDLRKKRNGFIIACFISGIRRQIPLAYSQMAAFGAMHPDPGSGAEQALVNAYNWHIHAPDANAEEFAARILSQLKIIKSVV